MTMTFTSVTAAFYHTADSVDDVIAWVHDTPIFGERGITTREYDDRTLVYVGGEFYGSIRPTSEVFP